MSTPQTFPKDSQLVERQPLYRMGLANEPVKQPAAAAAPPLVRQPQRSWLGADFSHVVVQR